MMLGLSIGLNFVGTLFRPGGGPGGGVDNYFRPDGVSLYFRPDGTSIYLRPA
jgi:hypothetical protein